MVAISSLLHTLLQLNQTVATSSTALLSKPTNPSRPELVKTTENLFTFPTEDYRVCGQNMSDRQDDRCPVNQACWPDPRGRKNEELICVDRDSQCEAFRNYTCDHLGDRSRNTQCYRYIREDGNKGEFGRCLRPIPPLLMGDPDADEKQEGHNKQDGDYMVCGANRGDYDLARCGEGFECWQDPRNRTNDELVCIDPDWRCSVDKDWVCDHSGRMDPDAQCYRFYFNGVKDSFGFCLRPLPEHLEKHENQLTLTLDHGDNMAQRDNKETDDQETTQEMPSILDDNDAQGLIDRDTEAAEAASSLELEERKKDADDDYKVCGPDREHRNNEVCPKGWTCVNDPRLRNNNEQICVERVRQCGGRHKDEWNCDRFDDWRDIQCYECGKPDRLGATYWSGFCLRPLPKRLQMSDKACPTCPCLKGLCRRGDVDVADNITDATTEEYEYHQHVSLGYITPELPSTITPEDMGRGDEIIVDNRADAYQESMPDLNVSSAVVLDDLVQRDDNTITKRAVVETTPEVKMVTSDNTTELALGNPTSSRSLPDYIVCGKGRYDRDISRCPTGHGCYPDPRARNNEQPICIPRTAQCDEHNDNYSCDHVKEAYPVECAKYTRKSDGKKRWTGWCLRPLPPRLRRRKSLEETPSLDVTQVDGKNSDDSTAGVAIADDVVNATITTTLATTMLDYMVCGTNRFDRPYSHCPLGSGCFPDPRDRNNDETICIPWAARCDAQHDLSCAHVREAYPVECSRYTRQSNGEELWRGWCLRDLPAELRRERSLEVTSSLDMHHGDDETKKTVRRVDGEDNDPQEDAPAVKHIPVSNVIQADDTNDGNNTDLAAAAAAANNGNDTIASSGEWESDYKVCGMTWPDQNACGAGQQCWPDPRARLNTDYICVEAATFCDVYTGYSCDHVTGRGQVECYMFHNSQGEPDWAGWCLRALPPHLQGDKFNPLDPPVVLPDRAVSVSNDSSLDGQGPY